MTFSKAGLDHAEARTNEQRVLMEKIEQDGVCPFCQEHFRKYHPKPIIKETENWFVTTNMSPYEGSDHHFLFVYKPSHITAPTDLSQEASAELLALASEQINAHSIKGGSFLMRFGEGGYSGSSVEHLHAHLVSGGHKSEGGEAMKHKIAYKKVT